MYKKIFRFSGVLICLFTLFACSSPEEKKLEFFKKGMSFYEQGDLVKARLEIKNAVQIDPKYAAAFHLLGKIELDGKNIKQAFGLFRKAVDLDPELLEAHVQLGRILLAAKQHGKAREKAEFVLSKKPDHPEGRLLMAGVLLFEKKPEEAKSLLETLMDEGLTHPETYLMVAAIEKKGGNVSACKQTLRVGIDKNPKAIKLYQVLTNVFIGEKSFDEAITLLEDIIRLTPDKNDLKFKLAHLYWQAERRESAANVLDNMINDADEPAVARIQVAQFYTGLKRVDRALETIEKGIDEYPENLKLRLALSHLQLAMRDYGKAIETLKCALALTKDDGDPDLLKVKNQLARIYLDRGDIDAAKGYTDAVLAVSANNVTAQFNAGQIYLRKKDGVNAVSAFRTVASEKPEVTGAYLHLAQAHMLNGEKKLAVDSLVTGIEANPGDIGLRRTLARLYAAIEDMASAEKEFRIIVEQNPKELKAKAELADFLFIRKKEKEAVGIYEKMISDYPQVPGGYLKLAEMMRRGNKPDSAKTLLEQGCRRLPESLPILTALVRNYLREGEMATAISVVKKRLQKNDKDAMGHNLLGQIHLSGKQFSLARDAFEKAIAINPEWQTPYNNLARSYLMQGKQKEAIAQLSDSLEKNPKNGAAYLTLGRLYERGGNRNKVVEVYEKALAKLPNLWPAANNLAFLLATDKDEKNLARAWELAVKAIKMQPDRPLVMDTLGWVHYQRGEMDLAVQELEKAIQKAPDSPVINYHLGMALIGIDRLDDAREKLEKAISEEKEFEGVETARKALDKLKAG